MTFKALRSKLFSQPITTLSRGHEIKKKSKKIKIRIFLSQIRILAGKSQPQPGIHGWIDGWMDGRTERLWPLCRRRCQGQSHFAREHSKQHTKNTMPMGSLELERTVFQCFQVHTRLLQFKYLIQIQPKKIEF